MATSSKKKTGTKHALMTFIALIVIIGLYVVITQFSNIAKTITERVATNALKTPVHISTMAIDLQNLTVEVGGIRIVTPAGHGFKKDNVMTIGRVFVEGESFDKSLLKFKDISVSGVDVYFEARENGTNLGVLKNNLKTDSAQPPATADNESDPIKVIIRKLNLTEAKLHPSLLIVSKDLQPVSLPNLNLTGIGEKSNGVLARDAISQVLNAVINAASKQGLSAGYFEGVTSVLGGDATNLKTKAEEVGNKLKGFLGSE